MSDSDDTDFLLSIHPNVFSIYSSESENSLLDSSRTVVYKPHSCSKVIGNLVKQVNSLEERLESLELSNSETLSSISFSKQTPSLFSQINEGSRVSRKSFTFPRRKKSKQSFKHENIRNLSITSLDSGSSSNRNLPHLHLKYFHKFKPLHLKTADCVSMDGDLSSIISTPSKKNDKLLLNEIDEFLTKVESFESPDYKHKADLELYPENIIKATSEYITNKLETDNTNARMSNDAADPILEKYIYLADHSQMNSDDKVHQHTSESSKPDTTPKHSESTTKYCYETKSPSVRKLYFASNDKKEQHSTSTPKKCMENTNTSHKDSFRPTSNKIYDKASQVLEKYKNQSSYLNSPKKEEFKLPHPRPYPNEIKDSLRLTMMQNKYMDTIDTDLLSLSNLWGDKRDTDKESVRLEEERMKREHCEVLIQDLQKKLLDQQERLAVAVKVDHAKDVAISKLREGWVRLTNSVERVEERHKQEIERINKDVEGFKHAAEEAQKKTRHFEAELYKALDLAHDYQEKNKQIKSQMKDLQDKINNMAANKDTVLRNKDKEIELLKENCETIMRLNKQSTDCVKNVEDALEKEKQEHEATKAKYLETNQHLQSLNEGTAILVQERDMLREKINEVGARNNMLEQQIADKQNHNTELMKKIEQLNGDIRSLHNHLDLQKSELKSHYQKQLEDAVLSKLQEFQLQLDRAEKEMELETRNKENVIVDTFNKQISRIEEQHKLEIKVLEEKHKEEMKLCRLQLVQANEKIGLLESKLSSLRRRRGEIASQLHSVMESQWRQALGILTGGHSAQTTLDHTLDTAAPSPLVFGPRSPHVSDFAAERLTDHQLHQYVKMMLAKPANIQRSVDDIQPSLSYEREDNEEPTSDRADCKDKQKRSIGANKPPWKG